MGGNVMIKKTTSILDWKIKWYFETSSDDIGEIMHILSNIGASSSIMEKAFDNMLEDQKNTGFTYSNQNLKRSAVIISRTTSPKEFINTFCHELRHLTDDIAEEKNMDIKGEDVAYLSGEISTTVYDIIGKLCCSCCRTKKNY